jgi:replicative DNA helicase
MSVDESNGAPFEVLAPEKPDFRRRSRRLDVDLSRIDKLPPHALEEEQCIIGCILLDPVHSLDECEGKITPDDAYDLRHQEILRTLFQMRATDIPIETVTLCRVLKDAGKLEAVGGPAYLSALPDAVPSAANLPTYLAVVLEKSALRKALQSASNAIAKIHDAGDNADAVLAEIEVGFEEVRGMRQRASEGRIVQAKAVVGQYIKWQEERHRTKGALSGMATGFVEFDKLTDGLQAGELALIAARPSGGKTAISLDVAANAAFGPTPAPVLYVSAEMAPRSLVRRMTSAVARVPMEDMRNGQITDAQFKRMTRAGAQIAKAPLHFVDAVDGITCTEVAGLIASARKKLGVKLVIVDYIQQIRASKPHEKRYLEVAEVCKVIRGAAHRNNVAVVCLAQLGREMEKDKGRRPRFGDLRECGNLEQDADLIVFLHRNRSGDEGVDPNDTELIVSKQRDGATGMRRVLFLPEFCHFVNPARQENEEAPPPRQKHWYEGD